MTMKKSDTTSATASRVPEIVSRDRAPDRSEVTVTLPDGDQVTWWIGETEVANLELVEEWDGGDGAERAIKSLPAHVQAELARLQDAWRTVWDEYVRCAQEERAGR